MDSAKNAIRREMRRRRRALPLAVVRAAEFAALERVRSFAPYRGARTVVAYVATDGEFPTASLIDLALEHGKRVFLPRVDGNEMVFAEYRPDEPMHEGRFGILEPAGGPLVSEPDAQVIAFVPVVAWDDTGARLGRGGGFYDRTLSQLSGAVCRVGLAFDCQRHAALPTDPWDVRLDYVVTERTVWRCGDGNHPAPIRKEDTDSNGLRVGDTWHCRPERRRAGLGVGGAQPPADAAAGGSDAGNGGTRAPGGAHRS